MFTEKDIQQIQAHGVSVETVQAQIETIQSGMVYSHLVEAAHIGNGILRCDEKQQVDLMQLFDNERNTLKIIKFVPASGAATRMFQFLFQFLNDYDGSKPIAAYSESNTELSVFLNGLEKFPFYEIVRTKTAQSNPNFYKLSKDQQLVGLVKTMLGSNQMNYGFYPKGLLPFHKYKTHVATAFEEHLMEATLYATSNNMAHLHFTVSEMHKGLFRQEYERVKQYLEKATQTTFNVSFSCQNKATDTIAITSNNALYRNEDDLLVFRPSGHGALIDNLNALHADIIFIKNIDNIVVFEQNKLACNYKKMLAGVLIKLKTQAFKYLHRLDDAAILEDEIHNIALFVINRLHANLEDAYENFTIKEKRRYLHAKLNRPIRVCGMVKNEGEPGGGPFWVQNTNGNCSLQIVEFAQIDFENEEQNAIAKNAHYFNPTDLVCGVKNYKGEKFDLTQYVDPKAAFITLKSQNGVEIKALELPGLWNGSMAHWNSIFVEIPVSTFNPVKTVNDLLKPAHQA